MAKKKFQKNKYGKGKKSVKIALFVMAFALLAVAITLLISKIEFKVEKVKIDKEKTFVSFDNSTFIRMKLPAVDAGGNGVVTELDVEAMPGSGRILVDIDNLLFWDDTQQSMRIARNVASNITGLNASKYDFVYNIYANASIIGGPSAGAALAIATIASLEGKKLNESVMITGSINHDGSIGPVGEILAKAKAAKNVNATLFLVPMLQSRDVTYNTVKHCEKYGWTEVCTIEQIPEKIKVGEQAGINIVEVSTVKEAFDYFIR